MWYFYWQKTGEDPWELAEAKLRSSIINSLQPAFTTALDLDAEITDDMSREDLSKVHYKGSLYFDFDSDSIEDVIPKFQKFLSKLTEIEIDLRQVALYASGGKGFHVVIPMEMFIEKPSTAGYTHLPAIYKEIAESLYVDTLDMRVYSAKRGRMFRTENVLRTNGKYKVQLSVQQAREITPELYEELTSKPGPGWQLSPPVFNPDLALLFQKSKDKVAKAVAARRSTKADAKLVATFGGQFPESLQKVGRCEHIREGVGFQQIATQMAITANALGQTEDQLLQMCEGLIENHQSDGFRYNTPSKRRKELLRMYHYMHDNPCYEFSGGGIKSLLDKSVPTPDLDIPIDDEHGALAEDEELELEDSVTKGVRFNREGIFVKQYDKESKEYVVIRISHLGMDNVALMKSLGSEEVAGFEVDIYVSGQPKGRLSFTSNTMVSSSQLKQAISSYGTSVQINDQQSNAMLDLLRKKAEVNNNIVINVPREGVDVVPLHESSLEKERAVIIYAAPTKYGVIKAGQEPAGYRLQTVNGQDGEFKSDLLAAPVLSGAEDELEFFNHFFKLYDNYTMSRALGFYLACFLTQLVRHRHGQFPMLQVYGEAGTGKTSMNRLLANLHFYSKVPTIWSAGDMTPFALNAMLQSSGSIPIIFDEFKRREMPIRKGHDFMMIMRNNYTGNSGGRGRVSKDSGASTLAVSRSASVAPLVFLGEEFESQTAILDRAVVINMLGKKATGSGGDWGYCEANRRILGRWGHLSAVKALEVNLDEMDAHLAKFEQQLHEASRYTLDARPAFNNAVICLGLEFGRMTLSGAFGETFNDQMLALQNEVIHNVHRAVPKNQSESSKVLTVLAALSARPENDPYHLVYGQDFLASVDKSTQEPCVDIHLRNAWDKYSRHKRSQGEDPLYHAEAAFISAMTSHRAALDTVCAGSELKGGRPSVKVVRFSLRQLYDEEMVEEFQGLEKDNVLKY